MAGDGSAYAALGLEPGADSAAIEQAYKRLIKEHHPDRDGGDGTRAAEINRAYRELRAIRDLRDPLELNDELAIAGDGRRGGILVMLALLLFAAAFLYARGSLEPVARGLISSAGFNAAGGHARPAAADADVMDRPLHVAEINAAAASALHLSRSKDEMALASASRDCHRLLRDSPTLLQLDRCAAFDDAVVQLQDRDPLRDQGPFSELAVTGRLWSGATALSNDSLAIDGRFDRIRLQVELALAPAVQDLPANAGR